MANLETDAAFAAGLISYAGSFMIVPGGGQEQGKVVRYVLRSVNRRGAIERLAQIAGVGTSLTTSNDKEAMILTIQGQVLHRLMISLWDYLPKDRKEDYAHARRKIKTAKPQRTPRKAKRLESSGALAAHLTAEAVRKGLRDPR